MGGNKQRERPADLSRAQKRFGQWRRTKKPRSRIPQPLWELAVKLVAAHGLHRTARALKLDYYALKERVEAAPEIREEPPSKASAFLELQPVFRKLLRFWNCRLSFGGFGVSGIVACFGIR